MPDVRSICATCGHTYEWHDARTARRLLGEEPGIERACYRVVGNAACRCAGFAPSGEAAVPAPFQTGSDRLLKNLALTTLLVVLGIGLLYAYRAQTPQAPAVPVTRAVEEVRAGQVRRVTITGTTATLDLRDGTRQRTTIADTKDEVLAPAIAEYNRTHPSDKVGLDYETPSSTLATIASVLLSLLPVILVGAFLLYLFRQRTSR
jgi:hypothetical protein